MSMAAGGGEGRNSTIGSFHPTQLIGHHYLFQDILNSLYSPFHLTLTLLWVMFALPGLILFILLVLVLFIWLLLLRKYLVKSSKVAGLNLPGDSRNRVGSQATTVAFFHPYCNAGGGGERVLWCAIRSLQTRYDFVKCVVYTGDVYASPEKIMRKVKETFDIDIKRPVHFVYLNRRRWVEADMYPVLTLLGQSIGSLVLGMEALFRFTPDIFLDTMGYAFTLPLFRFLGGCRVGAYVHYPTISTDMIEKVSQRLTDFNNVGYISQSFILTSMKIFYYRLFAFVYGCCGSCCDVVMVNSSWTLNHINALWGVPQKTSVVYPPCNTKNLMELVIDEVESTKAKNPFQIVSLAQFRPEKNHLMQLQIFQKFLKDAGAKNKEKYRLLMVGSCRGKEDEERVRELKAQARKLKVDRNVQFSVNMGYEDLLETLTESIVGIHTMKDEHFGISVVDFMASGLVTLAHNSAGPKMDIVVSNNDVKVGYLADTIDGYVQCLKEIFHLKPQERFEIGSAARNSVKKRFSEETFKKRFLVETECLL